MIRHPSISVLVSAAGCGHALEPVLSYLESIERIRLTTLPRVPEDLSPYDVVMTGTEAVSEGRPDALCRFAQQGGGWMGLFGGAVKPLPELFGAQPAPAGPASELRVMFQTAEHPLACRLPDAVYLQGLYQALETTAEDTETLLYADWRYQHSAVLVSRSVGAGRVACTTLQDYGHPGFQQILYRILLELAGRPVGDRVLGVGLLGYSPYVGQAHGLGVEATPGLALRAACDLNPERLEQVRKDFPGLETLESAASLAEDPAIDVVIIATPPNTHAHLSLQMMVAGKHVVSEKPLALNRAETARLVETADRQQVHLGCHQNRRWDVDYLAIKQSLKEGRIGELFYVETFVGGFSHPCGYWHSHDKISGGTAYDWGAHYLDWVVSLIPERVVSVVGTRHNRLWHDVTNADQERVQVRFAGGQEAEFLHSDIAAARKPKWYLLGTEGAIVGQWRDVAAYEIDPVLYFEKHSIPATEMPPDLTLHRRHSSGRIVAQKLALPERRHFLFYRNLADHLLIGEPIEAPLEDSVKVVSILEAAARSAAKGGSVEAVDD
jgi:predicted dehydrogenase